MALPSGLELKFFVLGFAVADSRDSDSLREEAFSRTKKLVDP
jgi:hypothetical protein